MYIDNETKTGQYFRGIRYFILKFITFPHLKVNEKVLARNSNGKKIFTRVLLWLSIHRPEMVFGSWRCAKEILAKFFGKSTEFTKRMEKF